MRKSISALVISFLITSTVSLAQNEEDALKFSRTFATGTARTNGMAGSFGALGGDMSALATNPAGISLYRKGEFTFTPLVDMSYTRARFFGNEAVDNGFGAGIANAGITGVYEATGDNGWVSTHLAIGYNRTNSFSSRTTIDGFNPNSSILDIMAYIANGVPEEDLVSALETSSSLAYWTYLINPNGDGTYSPEIQTGTTRQTVSLVEGGSSGSTDIAFGGNYKNRLFLGGTLGFPRIKHKRESNHREEPDDTSGTLISFDYLESLSTNGNGFNMKVGAIYRPSDQVRFGVAVHSPTLLSLTHSWYYYMGSEFEGGVKHEDESAVGTFSYRITTPWKAIVSAAVLFGKSGALNVDYEYQDFTQVRMDRARLKGGNYTFTQENQNIKTYFSDVHNIRVGTEWRLDPMRFRAGYALYMNPYNSSLVTTNATRTVYSLGFGVKYSEWYLDFAYSISKWDSNHVLYDPSLVEVAQISNTMNGISITGGFRF